MSRRLVIDKATARRLDCMANEEWWNAYILTEPPVTSASPRTGPKGSQGKGRDVRSSEQGRVGEGGGPPAEMTI